MHPRGRADALFWIGLALWALGWCINLHSDSVLRSLRAPGETGDGLPCEIDLIGCTVWTAFGKGIKMACPRGAAAACGAVQYHSHAWRVK